MAKKQEKQNVSEHTMQVRISSFKRGFHVYNNVRLIRIRSKEYTLLIMADYLPTIGEIEGEISFVCGTEETVMQDIRAYYMHKANVFSLMLEEDPDAI